MKVLAWIWKNVLAILGIALLLVLVFVWIVPGIKNFVATQEAIVQKLDAIENREVDSFSTNDESSVEVSENVANDKVVLDFGTFGAYEEVFDSKRGMWTIGFWTESMVKEGKNLSDLKTEGGTITFTMPKDGWINNSGGELYVDGVQWNLGNYGENPKGETLIKEGQEIKVIYDRNNVSAGFQLWFAN